MCVAGFSQISVTAKENASSDAAAMALKLMDYFFTKQEMANGCCTEVEGRDLLRQDIIEGIRCECILYDITQTYRCKCNSV